MNPDDLQYTKEHEWIRVEEDHGTVGITDHATDELGEIVYVELPSVGDKFDANESFGTVESVKAVSELFMPVSGEITKINETLADSPEQVNDDAYGSGWMVQIRLKERSDLDNLLSAEEYKQYTSGNDDREG